MDLVWIIVVCCGIIFILIILCCLRKNSKEIVKRGSTQEIGITEITDFCKREVAKTANNTDIEKLNIKKIHKVRNTLDILNPVPKTHRSPGDINITNILKSSSNKNISRRIRLNNKSNNNTLQSDSNLHYLCS
jgi:hypothetical protein